MTPITVPDAVVDCNGVPPARTLRRLAPQRFQKALNKLSPQNSHALPKLRSARLKTDQKTGAQAGAQLSSQLRILSILKVLRYHPRRTKYLKISL